MNEELKTLQQAWMDAKAKEDEAKKARLLVENLILEKIGYTEGDPEFKSWKDDLKIVCTRKEEYDNAELMKLFPPQNWTHPECPFRVKFEVDAKKMTDFKINHNQYWLEKLQPLCKIKFSKPSFSVNTTKGGTTDDE